ncbi:hypothetical protein ACLOJK_034923, partial [Asimina triloba]
MTPPLLSPAKSSPSLPIRTIFRSRPEHLLGPIFMAKSNGVDPSFDHGTGGSDHFFQRHHPTAESSPTDDEHCNDQSVPSITTEMTSRSQNGVNDPSSLPPSTVATPPSSTVLFAALFQQHVCSNTSVAPCRKHHVDDQLRHRTVALIMLQL